MMQGPNDDNDDLLSYMEICDFDLENPSNLEMDLNMPDFSAFFEDAPEFDSPLQNLNQIPIQNQIQSQNQNQNQFASFDALNPNPNPNPILNPNPNFNPNFHPFFPNENPQTGQNPTRLNLNQNLHIPPPIFHHNNNNPSLNINSTNNNLSLNNNNYNNNNNLNNVASSSRGEMDNSRQSRKRPDAMPPQQNRGSGITINGTSSSSRYSGITNSGISNPGISNTGISNPGISNSGISNPGISNTGISNPGISNSVASESMQNNVGINGGGFVRNTRMRTDPVRNPNGSFSLNLPLYNTIPMPNPNPNNPINPNPNIPINPNLMMGIPNFRNPNSIPRIGTSFQAVPISVPASRVSNDDQIRRALINNINNNNNNNNNNNHQVRSQSQPITAGTSQARNNINNYNNLYYNNMNNNNNANNNNNGLSGFSIGSLNGSERPQFRRLLRPRTGTAGIQVPAVQNISRRREQTQVILDTYRQSVMDGRRRVARQMLGILRPGENISLEDIILFEQTIALRDSVPDRHRDMRLDVDNMSYEELLALEERIGNVSTGLNEDIIMKRLKQKLYVNNLSLSKEGTEPCCICQEEYEEGDKVGKLECGHDFHTACIKKWLVQKNLCPICKKPGLNA